MPHLYLPITSQPRELDAKILLALFAADRGISPLVGYKSAFYESLARLEPGVLVAHNARQKSENIRRFSKFGHNVVVLDEEALVRQSDEIFLGKHPRGAFEHVGHVLCWGQDDFDMWHTAGLDFRGGFSIVGNPRFDLMRPEVRAYFDPQVAALRERFGNYILLNTNFPTVNNQTPRGSGMRLAQWALDDRGRQIQDAFLTNKRRMFEAMLALVRPLAEAVAPLLLVIRPHPNEDHDPWHAAAAALPNIRVVFEGGVVPWLLGARALIHNNCTTAVEAAACDTPVLNFRPWCAEFDNELAHSLGADCADAGELAAAVRDIVVRSDRKSDAAHLSAHIASLSGELSCQRIVALVEALHPPHRRPSLTDMSERLKIAVGLKALRVRRATRLYLRRSGRRRLAVIRREFPHLSPMKMDTTILDYSTEQLKLFARQFPPLVESELSDRVGEFSKTLNRFKGMRVRVISDNMFTIERG